MNTNPLHNRLSPLLAESTDSEARLRFQPQSDCDIVEIAGRLHGPRCEYSRTLSAEYPLRQIAGVAEVFVPEPCYWTPSLPFLYELSLAIRTGDGKVREYSQPVGLRRWAAAGANFRLNGRRTVLRGASVDTIAPEQLADVHLAEATLIVLNPNAALCAAASRLGVSLIADLRAVPHNLAQSLAQLSWSPAVLLVLLDACQLASPPLRNHAPSQLPLAQCLTAMAANTDLAQRQPDVLAVELEANQRPPAWLSDSGKPIIVMRRGQTYTSFTDARRDCDRLQAELVPQFDLAGYFV